MEEKIFKGKCTFCGESFPGKEMTRHLNSWESRKVSTLKPDDKPGPVKSGFYLLFVEGRHHTIYWMHLEIQSKATLRDLDNFLREIWLECCGHLSAFTIEKKRYLCVLFEEE